MLKPFTIFTSHVPTQVIPTSCGKLFFLRSPRISYLKGFRFVRGCSTSNNSNSKTPQQGSSPKRSNNAGFQLEEFVNTDRSKMRLDSWIFSRMEGISRSRVQSSIRSGQVCVNGKVVDKVSYLVRSGDEVSCNVKELQPLKADPEDIPLNVVYEDDHVLVVNKPVDMVVHPAPGNPSGTLVNAILNHCILPIVNSSNCEPLPEEDASDKEETEIASVRPGVVHRLDKGTTGLVIVAKTEQSHSHLAEQFKKHSIRRVYISLTTGVPDPTSAKIDVPIGRDLSSRTRMVAGYGRGSSNQLRDAVSRYKVIEILAGGSCGLIEWRLETGRTHQIRAHAKYMGTPLMGDELYSGTKDMALSLLRAKNPPHYHSLVPQLVSRLDKHYLHAAFLKFEHPHTGVMVKISCPPPDDFMEILRQLRQINSTSVVRSEL